MDFFSTFCNKIKYKKKKSGKFFLQGFVNSYRKMTTLNAFENLYTYILIVGIFIDLKDCCTIVQY